MAKRTAARDKGEQTDNRMNIEYVALDLLRPYQNNPRDNAAAVSAVAASIQSYGFLVPLVADAEGVIVTGHTRYLAAQSLGMSEVPVIRAAHLGEDQLRAFRLIDNKVAEIATWDFDLLAGEIAALAETGIDLLPFGWTQEELDCLGDLVVSDCLDTELAEDKNDGVNGAKQERANSGNVVSRDPQSVRVAIGEINFFVDIKHYQEWAHGLRKDNEFDMERIVAELARRLGITARPFGQRRTDAEAAGVKVEEPQAPVETTKLAPRGRARANAVAVTEKAADEVGAVVRTNPIAVADKVRGRGRARK